MYSYITCIFVTKISTIISKVRLSARLSRQCNILYYTIMTIEAGTNKFNYITI